ncbi:MAG: divalent-cation tolerance protein CutA [Erythrobacter sp.]|nr:divalent-cation tolerance protein CutA [Erythrobacter sp.]
MNTVAAVAWCPFPQRQSARDIADVLLDEGLIACANIVGDIEAIFEWAGERGTANEVAVLFKTNSELLERMVQRLGQLHPYDTPAIVAWRCDVAHPATLDWLGAIGAEEQE